MCGSEFEPRPLNDSGLPRTELVREADSKIHFTAVYDDSTKKFTDIFTGKSYSADCIEVAVVDLF
jgi:hypothetical protein